MTLLTLLAAKEIRARVSSAHVANQTTDNLHDIQMWLEANKALLPDHSEITYSELMEMVTALIKAQETISAHLHVANEWANALCEKDGKGGR